MKFKGEEGDKLIIKVSKRKVSILSNALLNFMDLIKRSTVQEDEENMSWEDIFIKRIGEDREYSYKLIEELHSFESEHIEDVGEILYIKLSKKDFLILIKSFENLFEIASNDKDKKDDRWWESEFHARMGASRASAREILNQLKAIVL